MGRGKRGPGYSGSPSTAGGPIMSVLTVSDPAVFPPITGEPLAELVGTGTAVPLVQGSTTSYANLDYAASAPALRAVADRVAELLPLYASVHRGAGYASAVCTSAYEAARREVASFTGARDTDVVVFTRH